MYVKLDLMSKLIHETIHEPLQHSIILTEQRPFRVVPLDVIVASGHVALNQSVGSLLDHDAPAGRDAVQPEAGRRFCLRAVQSSMCRPATKQQDCEQQV